MKGRGAGLALALLAVGLLAAGASAAPKRRDPGQPFASPGAVVAAEIAFARLAQRKGQWAAFRATASEDAVMFVPQAVVARDWLKRQKEPARAVTWQPHHVWSSCDGSLAVAYGASQYPGGRVGYFTTVWERQRDGEYKWVMDQGDDVPAPLPAPDMIGSAVASCDRKAGKDTAGFLKGTHSGKSADGTLAWNVAVDTACGRVVTIGLYRGAGKPMEVVLEKRVAGAAGSGAVGDCGGAR